MNKGYKQAVNEKKSAMAGKMAMNYSLNGGKKHLGHTMGAHVGSKYGTKYTMTAHGKDGEKYSGLGNVRSNQKYTMNAATGHSRPGERPVQAGGKSAPRINHTMTAVQPQYEGGEKYPQSNPKKSFSSTYTQHGK
jgi:hypothetical protein